MDIIEALQSEKHFLRVSDGDKWLVFDNETNKWVVYQRKYAAKKTVKLICTRYQTKAIAILLKEAFRRGDGLMDACGLWPLAAFRSIQQDVYAGLRDAVFLYGGALFYAEVLR